MDIQELPHFSELQRYLIEKTSGQRREDVSKELEKIKNYSSGFNLIDKAVRMIPERSFNPRSVLEAFNEIIAGYSKLIKPFPSISCLRELEVLEEQLEQLEDSSLQKLWEALWDKPLAGLADRPENQTIDEIRTWFEDEQNQYLLDEVTILRLSGCKIVKLPKEIFRLRNLKELDLSENLIEVMPESIKVWKNLERCNLYHNELIYLPYNGIKHLENLQYLNVKANCITELPRSIRCLKRLKELNVKGNYLKQLPKEIGQCTTLEVLNLADNDLVELHPDIKNLTALKIFSAAGNQLKSLPEGLESWKQIKTVKLGYNFLDDITEKFFRELWPTATQISLAQQS